MAGEVTFKQYGGEATDLPQVMELVSSELSEPYSIFTYRYFICNWPELCFTAHCEGQSVGTVVCKMDNHGEVFRGYIAMLVVIKPFRSRQIGSELVRKSIEVMRDAGCEEVVLEAEVTNKGALRLYENLGFIRDKRLHKYYLNGVDAYRLKLLLPYPQEDEAQQAADALASAKHLPLPGVCDVLAQDHAHGHGGGHSHGHGHGHSHGGQPCTGH